MTNHRIASPNEIADGIANLGDYLYREHSQIVTVEIIGPDVIAHVISGTETLATILFYVDPECRDWTATVTDDTQAGGVPGDRVPGLVMWQADIAWAKDVVRDVIEAVKGQVDA